MILMNSKHGLDGNAPGGTSASPRGKLAMQAIRVSILAAALGLGTVAHGTPVVWTLQEVTLTDGQSLTGSFTYDESTDIYSDSAVVSSGTAAHPSALWNTQFSFSPPRPGVPALVLWLMAGPATQTDETLILLWNQYGQQQRLTDAGGVVALRTAGPPNGPIYGVFATCGYFLNPNVEFPTFAALPTCENATVLQYTEAIQVVGGTLSAVPAPSAIWLLGTGLAGLGGRRWLRRKAAN